MIAGGLMFVVGAFYLAFEERILATAIHNLNVVQGTRIVRSRGSTYTTFKLWIAVSRRLPI